jgi:N-acetylneuraminate synthase
MKIVAEISASHDGSIDKAIRLIEEAAFSGADCVKFQTFEPDLLVGNPQYTIDSGPWSGFKLIDLYKKSHTPKEWHSDLFEYARDLHIEPFSTPFHESDVDFLETLDCSMYKISSFEIINTGLIRYAANTGKPLVISTGMASWEEIETAVLSAVSGGCVDLTLLHCISQYPTDLEKVNLKSMVELGSISGKIGISDHSMSLLVPIAATSLGASMIEKHISLNRNGLDKFALLPNQFKEMVEEVSKTRLLLGQAQFGCKPGEEASYKLRPSLYWNDSIPKGTTIEERHLKIGRPSEGAPIFLKNQIIGKSLKDNVKKGSPVVPD